MNTEYFLFIVDTNAYAGNFERDMCAYMTGKVGDCGKGEKKAEIYHTEETEDFIDILSVPDDKGCRRPVSMWDSPDGDSNSVAIYFNPSRPPTRKQIDLLKRRAHKFLTAPREKFDSCPTKILGFRLLEKRVEYKEVAL